MKAEPNILVVEDNPDDVKLLQRLFTKAGLGKPLQFVADGVEAMSYLLGREKFSDREKFPEPNILLIDLHMPRVNGLELMTWLRTQPDLEHLIIVALSSSSEQEEIDRAYHMGANSYLPKSGSALDLERIVQTFYQYWVRCNYLPSPGANAPAASIAKTRKQS